jgi:hypothetical protein
MTGRQWSWGVDLSTGTRSPSPLDALPRGPDELEVRITEPDKPVEGPERVVPAASGRREANLPLELRRRICGIGDVDHGGGLDEKARRQG